MSLISFCIFNFEIPDYSFFFKFHLVSYPINFILPTAHCPYGVFQRKSHYAQYQMLIVNQMAIQMTVFQMKVG